MWPLSGNINSIMNQPSVVDNNAGFPGFPLHALSSLSKMKQPPEQKISFQDSAGYKTGDYSKSKIDSLVKSAKAVGVDPYEVLALGLQEQGLGNSKSKVTEASRSRRDRNGVGSVGNVGFDDNDYKTIEDLVSKGFNSEDVAVALALKKKSNYAKSLGFNDDAMRLQAYNGYGTITKDHFGGANKAYGVEIGNGIDLKKNPLYGKRLLQLREDLKKNKDISSLIQP